MKKVLFILLAGIMLFNCTKKPADTNHLVVAIGTVGKEISLMNESIEIFKKTHPEVTIEILKSPKLVSNRLGLYLQYLNSHSSDVDVYMIDIIWPGMLTNHMIDLKKYIPENEIKQHFESIVKNNTVSNKIIGIPWFTAAGLLYYRKDLLKEYGFSDPPKTWDELEKIAKVIMTGERKKGNKSFWGFVWQGNKSESLACNALEWQYSNNGGNIINSKSEININKDNFKEILLKVINWINTISPPGIITYGEEEARTIFQSGNAAFMRNWPYAYSLGNSKDSKIKNKIGIAILPAGKKRSASTIGGWQLAVSKYSSNTKLAAEFVRFLTSKEEQKRRAIKGSFLPTVKSLYQDEEVIKESPLFQIMGDVLSNSVARPSSVSGHKYNEISNIYFTAVHEIISGNPDVDKVLNNLSKDIQKVINE